MRWEVTEETPSSRFKAGDYVRVIPDPETNERFVPFNGNVTKVHGHSNTFGWLYGVVGDDPSESGTFWESQLSPAVTASLRWEVEPETLLVKFNNGDLLFDFSTMTYYNTSKQSDSRGGKNKPWRFRRDDTYGVWEMGDENIDNWGEFLNYISKELEEFYAKRKQASLRWEIVDAPEEGDRVRIICRYEYLQEIGLPELQYGDEGTVESVDSGVNDWKNGGIEVLMDRDRRADITASFPFKNWKRYLEVIKPYVSFPSTASLRWETVLTRDDISLGTVVLVDAKVGNDMAELTAEVVSTVSDARTGEVSRIKLWHYKDAEGNPIPSDQMRQYKDVWLPIGIVKQIVSEPRRSSLWEVTDPLASNLEIYLQGLGDEDLRREIAEKIMQLRDPTYRNMMPHLIGFQERQLEMMQQELERRQAKTSGLRWEIATTVMVGDMYENEDRYIKEVKFVGTLQELIDQKGKAYTKDATNNFKLEQKFDQLDPNMIVVGFDYSKEESDASTFYWDPEPKFLKEAEPYQKIASLWEIQKEYDYIGPWLDAGAPPLTVGSIIHGGDNERNSMATYKVVYSDPPILYLRDRYFRYFPEHEQWWWGSTLDGALKAEKPSHDEPLDVNASQWEVHPEADYIGAWIDAGAPELTVGDTIWSGSGRKGTEPFKVVHSNPTILYNDGEYYRYFSRSAGDWPHPSYPWWRGSTLAGALNARGPLGTGGSLNDAGHTVTSSQWEVAPESHINVGDKYASHYGWTQEVMYVGSLQGLIEQRGEEFVRSQTNKRDIREKFDELDPSMLVVGYEHYRGHQQEDSEFFWDPEELFVNDIENDSLHKIASRWEVQEPGDFEEFSDDELARAIADVQNHFNNPYGSIDGSDIRFERALEKERERRGIREDDPRILEHIIQQEDV